MAFRFCSRKNQKLTLKFCHLNIDAIKNPILKFISNLDKHTESHIIKLEICT